jgi:serine/threonine protein kinase
MSKLPIMDSARKKCGTARRQVLSAGLPNSWPRRYLDYRAVLHLANKSWFTQILLEQRYGRAVDWWAFGVLTYEMLLGQSPFRGDDEDEIFDAILEDEPLYPITMPRDAVSVLQKVSTPLPPVVPSDRHELLNRDPTRRLGSGKEDAEEIKRHPFFRDVNFDDVVHKRIPPPYFPTIVSSPLALH